MNCRTLSQRTRHFTFTTDGISTNIFHLNDVFRGSYIIYKTFTIDNETNMVA